MTKLKKTDFNGHFRWDEIVKFVIFSPDLPKTDIKVKKKFMRMFYGKQHST